MASSQWNISTVSRQANCFRGGCVSIYNDPIPGRPTTSTDERSVKLVVVGFYDTF